MISVGILTISDRASRGVYDDQGGPALAMAVKKNGWNVGARKIVPDSKSAIQQAIRGFAREGCVLVLTTGGTGLSRRDVTPEAVGALADYELPGFGETMRAQSLKITPNALLSRTLAVVFGKILVICLPGSPKGAVECLGFVAKAIPHAVELLQKMPTRHGR